MPRTAVLAVARTGAGSDALFWLAQYEVQQCQLATARGEANSIHCVTLGSGKAGNGR